MPVKQKHYLVFAKPHGNFEEPSSGGIGPHDEECATLAIEDLLNEGYERDDIEVYEIFGRVEFETKTVLKETVLIK